MAAFWDFGPFVEMGIHAAWVVAAVLLLAWFWYISRGTSDADPNTLAYRLHRAWRRLAFWAGDVRFDWQWYFGVVPLPLVSWTHHEYGVSHEAFLSAMRAFQRGDIILATKFGYIFSNSAIPGCFKHAAIVEKEPSRSPVSFSDGSLTTVADLADVRLVEAISEGVVRRHPQWARADLMVVVRPKYARDSDRKEASRIAGKLVGCRYDANFDFNIDEELKHIRETRVISDGELEEDKTELRRANANVKAEFDMAFSCTEVVATCWWHMRRRLGISRKKVRGRMCITADQFVNRDFHIVWTNVSAETARANGLHEEGVRELENYWKHHTKPGK